MGKGSADDDDHGDGLENLERLRCCNRRPRHCLQFLSPPLPTLGSGDTNGGGVEAMMERSRCVWWKWWKKESKSSDKSSVRNSFSVCRKWNL